MKSLTIPLSRTHENFKFCEELRDSINKTHPDSAKILSGLDNTYYVAVTDEYYRECCSYVMGNCKINNSRHLPRGGNV